MVGHSKGPAGHAVLRSGDERYLWLDVDYGVRSATYRLETIDAQDRVTVAGAVAVAGGHGSWGGEIHGPTAGRGAARRRRRPGVLHRQLRRGLNHAVARPDQAGGSRRSWKNASTWSSAARVG